MPRKSPINQLNTNGALVVLWVWSWQTTGSHIAFSSTHCEGVFCFRIFRSDNGYRTANDYQFAHHHGAEKGRRDLASPESVIFQSIPPPTTRPSVNAKILLVSLRSMMKTFCNWQYSRGMWMSDWMTGWRRGAQSIWWRANHFVMISPSGFLQLVPPWSSLTVWMTGYQRSENPAN